MLDEGKNNYLASVCVENGQAGLCFADISTGAKEIIKPESIAILIAEVIISIALFVIFYRKNGFEKD